MFNLNYISNVSTGMLPTNMDILLRSHQLRQKCKNELKSVLDERAHGQKSTSSLAEQTPSTQVQNDQDGENSTTLDLGRMWPYYSMPNSCEQGSKFGKNSSRTTGPVSCSEPEKLPVRKKFYQSA